MPGIQVVGGASGVTAEVDTNTRALRITPRPTDVLTLGSYVVSAFSGTMAAGLAAASEIFQYRWTDSTRLAILRSVRFNVNQTSNVQFTSGIATFEAIIARGWSGDGSGGASVDMSGNNNKKRTSMGTSLISGSAGSIRISTTAALTAGTKTKDSRGFGSLSAFTGIAGTGAATQYLTVPMSYLWTRDTSDEYPVVFAQNEGFVIQATVPAAGTWGFSVSLEWLETAAFTLLAGAVISVLKGLFGLGA